jgi:hypothetical protein
MTLRAAWLFGALAALPAFGALAQSDTDLAVLKGLSPFAVLSKTTAGNAALAANYTVAHGIQTGEITQPTLQPFVEQQQQALRDVFITSGNLAQLADGLGSTLEAGYIARAHYIDRTTNFTNLSPTVANVIAYAVATTLENSTSAKFLFANETADGKATASAKATSLLTDIGGKSDIYGRAYHLAAGSAGADPLGNSRPFQTDSHQLLIVGPDYFNMPADSWVYNHGPLMDLTESPSFPSGHTTYGYTGALVLAVLVPERYTQMMVRGAEYGNDRILVGAHYPMDVIGGRTLATYDMAHLLANDPAYLGRAFPSVSTVNDFQAIVKAARKDMIRNLEAACGKAIANCALEDTGRLSNPQANEALYADTQTYNLPVVYPQNVGMHEDVAKLAPEAGYLLTVAFPSLSLKEADEILTDTEGPGGGFLDNGSPFGVYSRLNLYAAAARAGALVSGERVGAHSLSSQRVRDAATQ